MQPEKQWRNIYFFKCETELHHWVWPKWDSNSQPSDLWVNTYRLSCLGVRQEDSCLPMLWTRWSGGSSLSHRLSEWLMHKLFFSIWDYVTPLSLVQVGFELTTFWSLGKHLSHVGYEHGKRIVVYPSFWFWVIQWTKYVLFVRVTDTCTYNCILATQLMCNK